ncbi:hypothetical protein [Nocardia sp. NPDC059229]|uniref:hypothetical protein n=1 Tax=Nocardia sp. NPDC059229 TaxID=3346778 RepID=UPI0036C8CA19
MHPLVGRRLHLWRLRNFHLDRLPAPPDMMVFSKALNPNMTVLAVEGSFASVIGGAPAAAMVFARTVDARTAADPRIRRLQEEIAMTEDPGKRAELVTELADERATVRAEHLSALGTEFDAVHSIQRAVEVGSVDAVVSVPELRARIAAAIAAVW